MGEAGLVTRTALALISCLAVACGSSDAPPNSAQPDGAAPSEASTVPDDAQGGPDDAAPLDMGIDGGGDAGPAFGDRNLGLVEPYPDSLLIQNGGRFYNLRKPPTGTQRAAAGDGVTDDTAAFEDAFDFLEAKLLAATGVPGSTDLEVPNGQKALDVDSFWLYVPDGTYRVTGTLTYRGVGLQQLYRAAYDGGMPFGTPWFDLSGVRLVGQSRERTVIKLADHAAGFGDATKPRPVVTFQHPDTTFNDWNANNLMKNVTVDTGSGNPGAVGILAQGANVSGVRNVLVRSGDGAGVYGIWMPIGPVQGCYHDLTVTGFDYGIAQTNTGGTNGCYENVTLDGQNKAGVLVTQGGFVVRNLLATETAHGAQAVLMNTQGAQLLVLDSELEGTQGSAITVTSSTGDSLFVRNVSTRGYASAVSFGGHVVEPGPRVTEYTSGALTLFDGGAPASLALPVEQVPIGTWFDPATQWASVEDYRADGGASDTAAAQAALGSGKPVVTFPKAAYATKPLSVPATVQRVDLLFAQLDSGGEFDVTEASSSPIFFENGSGATYSIVVKAQRDVVLRMGGNLFHNPTNLPVKLFIENGGGGYDADFAPSAGRVWARGLDIEYRTDAQFVASGGSLWIMGYKTEGNATVLKATGGSHAEVLGGYTWLPSAPTTAMIVNQGSSVSFIGTQTSDDHTFAPVVSESQGGVTRTADESRFPAYVGRGAADFVVPLYVGRAP